MRGAAFLFGRLGAVLRSGACAKGVRTSRKKPACGSVQAGLREKCRLFFGRVLRLGARPPCTAYWVVVVPVLLEVPDVDELELELELEELSARRTVSEIAVPCFCVPLGEIPVTMAVA